MEDARTILKKRLLNQSKQKNPHNYPKTFEEKMRKLMNRNGWTDLSKMENNEIQTAPIPKGYEKSKKLLKEITERNEDIYFKKISAEAQLKKQFRYYRYRLNKAKSLGSKIFYNKALGRVYEKAPYYNLKQKNNTKRNAVKHFNNAWKLSAEKNKSKLCKTSNKTRSEFKKFEQRQIIELLKNNNGRQCIKNINKKLSCLNRTSVKEIFA